MATYNTPAALTAIRSRFFPYTADMFPGDFKEYFYKLPVLTPSATTIHVQATRYCSGSREPRVTGRQEWRAAVKKHFKAKGREPGIENWMSSDRVGAVFNGHGLPEELSLVCQMALASGFKTEGTLAAWADQMLQYSPTALKVLKQSFNVDTEHMVAIGQMAITTLKLFGETDEAKEGITAFNEKRQPDFSDYRGN